MFKHILIPISSEYYSKELLKRSITLAETLHSKLHIVYIIEEKTLHKAEERVDSYRTSYERTTLKNVMVKEQMKAADTIVFNNVKEFLSNREIIVEETILEGEFSEVITQELQRKKYDLVLMGFDKQCLLNYRVFDHIDIPLWVVSKSGKKSILAICSNLAPNKKVPHISMQLSKVFNWDLRFLFIVDPQDSVEVDEHLQRSGKKTQEELLKNAQIFAQEMKHQGYNTEIVIGPLEKETAKAARQQGSTLIVVGREQKQHHLLDLTGKSIKRKIAENCDYSVLFIN